MDLSLQCEMMWWNTGKYKGKVLTLEPHLTVFQGFQQLEAEQKTEMGPYCYESSRAAFDAAVNALKEIIS